MNQRKNFRFVAYLSPPPAKVGYGEFADNANYIDEENYRTMTDCGFDSAIGLFEKRVAHYLAGMKQAEKVGMEYFVRDQFKSGSLEGIIDYLGKRRDAAGLLAQKGDKIAERFDKYGEYSAYAGILASDEPPATKFPAIRTVQDWFKARYPEKKFIVNLLPTYANPEQLSGIQGIRTFDFEKDYVRTFIEIVQPEILSYDHYALIYDAAKKENVLREDYLRNLEVFAEASKDTQKPFYNFLLTIGHLFYRTVKTYADIAWQVYTSMAYGVKGVQTFTYWTLLSNGETEKITGALVDREGNKMPAWYAMQRVIREVRSFEDLYMRYHWQGTMPVRGENPENPNFSALKKPLKEHKAVSDIHAEADCIIGAFEENGKYAFLIANFTDPAMRKTAKIFVRFASEKILVCRGGKREEVQLDEGKFSCTLESGEGAFLVLE